MEVKEVEYKGVDLSNVLKVWWVLVNAVIGILFARNWRVPSIPEELLPSKVEL
jgi:hypothetical protein